MATFYGHGRGKAGSHPPEDVKPSWLKLKPEEIEEIVLKLAKQDINSAKIGLILRDSYGIPSIKAITGKKIQKILAEKNIEKSPLEIIALKKRINALKKHLEKNRKDKKAKRGLQLSEEKVRRLENYHKKKLKK